MHKMYNYHLCQRTLGSGENKAFKISVGLCHAEIALNGETTNIN